MVNSEKGEIFLMPKGIEGMSYFNRDNLKSLAD